MLPEFGAFITPWPGLLQLSCESKDCALVAQSSNELRAAGQSFPGPVKGNGHGGLACEVGQPGKGCLRKALDGHFIHNAGLFNQPAQTQPVDGPQDQILRRFRLELPQGFLAEDTIEEAVKGPN